MAVSPPIIVGVLTLLVCIGYMFFAQTQLLSNNTEQLSILRKLNEASTPHSQQQTSHPITCPSIPECPDCTCNFPNTLECKCDCTTSAGTAASTTTATCPECDCDRPLYDGEPKWMTDSKEKKEVVKFLSGLHMETPEYIDPNRMPTNNLIDSFDPLSKKVDLKKFKKKVFIDLGGRDGDSANWFINSYPFADQFDEIWVFEADPAFNELHKGKPWKFFNLAVWIRNETVYLGSQGVGSSIVVPDQKDKQGVEGFDFSEFVMTHFDYDDFVVCKMDIEGVEFQLVPKMLSDLTIFKIDELMLECHYWEWTHLFKDIFRKDCVRMINNLRSMTLYVHEWN